MAPGVAPGAGLGLFLLPPPPLPTEISVEFKVVLPPLLPLGFPPPPPPPIV